MKYKFGLLFLSAMVATLAIGFSSNNIASAKDIAIEVSNESCSEERTRRRYDNDEISDQLLTVGESSYVSKNIISTNQKIYQEKVIITLNNVIRGEEAKEQVNSYNKSNTTSKIPELLDDSLEYVILEYTTKLPEDIKQTNNGQSSNVSIQVYNIDGDSLLTNDANYILRAINFEKSQNLNAGDTGVTKTIITLPKNINQFIVKLGDNPSDMSSYIINK